MNKKQKILLITGIYPRFKGGAEYQMRLIADQLKEEYEIVFVYLGDIPGEIVKKTYNETIEGYKSLFYSNLREVGWLAYEICIQ